MFILIDFDEERYKILLWLFSRAGDLFDATGKFTSWESARIYGLASPVPESVLEHIPEQIKGDINEVRKMQHLLHFLFKKRVKMFPSLWSFLRGILVGEGLIVIHKMRKLGNPLHEEACENPALQPRADVTRTPKQEYQWPHNKGLMSSKKFLKKEN